MLMLRLAAHWDGWRGAAGGKEVGGAGGKPRRMRLGG